MRIECDFLINRIEPANAFDRLVVVLQTNDDVLEWALGKGRARGPVI
jgi:hypothetical protein